MLVSPPLWTQDSPALGLLREARRATLAVLAAGGPHATPVAVAWHGGRLWALTPRRSLKARTVRANPSVSAVVEHDGRTLCLGGSAVLADPLRPTPALLRVVLPAGLAVTRYLTLHRAETTRIVQDALGDALLRLDTGGLAARALLGLHPRWAVLLEGGEVIGRWGRPPTVAAVGAARTSGTRTVSPTRLPGAAGSLARGAGPAVLTVAVGAASVSVPCTWDGARAHVQVAAAARRLLPHGRGTLPACVTLAGEDRPGLHAKSGVLLRGGVAVTPGASGAFAFSARQAVWWQGHATGTVALAGTAPRKERHVD